MQEHQSVAKESGARIVHSCGFDSIPSDLGVFFLQQKAMEKYGSPFSTVKCGVRSMVGEFSGGTSSFFKCHAQSIRKDPNMISILMNPFSLAEGFEGPAQPDGNVVFTMKILINGWLLLLWRQSILKTFIDQINCSRICMAKT